MIYRKMTIAVVLCFSILLMQLSVYAAIGNSYNGFVEIPTDAPKLTQNNLNLSDGITIDEGDDLSEWTRSYNLDLSIDANNHMSGSESLKIVAQNPSIGYFTLEKHAENIINTSDVKNFEINMNIPDVSKISAIGIAFFEDNVNYIRCFYNYIGSYELSNGWNKIRRAKSDFATSDNSVDWSKVKCMRLTFYTNGNEPITVNLDRISYNVKGIPKLMFTFEDGYYEVLTNAYSVLDSKGFKANVMPIKSRAETGDINYLDIMELNYLYYSGWDIGNHTETHPLSTAGYTTQTKTSEYLNCQNWLLKNGWNRGAYHGSYPSGFYDKDIAEIVKSIGVKTAQSDRYGIQPTVVEDICNLKSIKIGMYIPIELVKSEIDRAIETGSTIILTAYKVVDYPTFGFEVSKEYFNELVDYVYSKTSIGAIDVVTISQWYEQYMNLVPPIEPTVTIPPIIDVPEVAVINSFSPSCGEHYQTSEGTLLDEFDNIAHSYVVKRGKLDLDSNSISGNASIRLTSQVEQGGSNIVFENHGSFNYDLSDMENVEFNIYIPDTTKINLISVAFYSDHLYHNSYYINYIGNYEFQNGWNKIVRRQSDFASNNGDWAKIKCFRITVYANEGCNPYINLDRMVYNIDGLSKVLFTFDDAWTDIYTKAYSIMEEKGFKGTAWAIKELSSNDNPNFMSVEQLNTLYNNGWDIGNHTENHVDNIAKLTAEQKRAQYLNCQNWLLSNNWSRAAYHVCYPTGTHDEELISILQDLGVKSARTTNYGVQPVSVENIYKLKCIPVGYTISMDLIKSEIDEAIETGGTVMFMFHKVEDNPTITYEISTESFKELVDYIDGYVKAGKTEVQTISQWYDGYIADN